MSTVSKAQPSFSQSMVLMQWLRNQRCAFKDCSPQVAQLRIFFSHFSILFLLYLHFTFLKWQINIGRSRNRTCDFQSKHSRAYQWNSTMDHKDPSSNPVSNSANDSKIYFSPTSDQVDQQFDWSTSGKPHQPQMPDRSVAKTDHLLEKKRYLELGSGFTVLILSHVWIQLSAGFEPQIMMPAFYGCVVISTVFFHPYYLSSILDLS